MNRFVVAHGLGWLTHVLGVELTYVFPLAIVLVWFRRDPARRRAAFAAAVALGLAALLYYTTNHLIARPRPDISVPGVHAFIHTGSAYESAFPSGHAAAAFAVVVGLGALEPAWFGWLLLVAILNSFGRVAAGVHFPTDVLGGAVLGSLAAAFVALHAARLDPMVRWFSRVSDRIVPFLPHPSGESKTPSAGAEGGRG